VGSAVAKESRKGYDLLFVGVEHMRNPDGRFSRNVDTAAQGFQGPLALTIAGSHPDRHRAEGFNILVPVNGTEPSRRGPRSLSPVTAQARATYCLHVASRTQKPTDGRPGEAGRAQSESALLGTFPRSPIAMDTARSAPPFRPTRLRHAIVAEARRGKTDLIVIGAGRRTGDTLYLGQTVASVLAQWDGAIVWVATERSMIRNFSDHAANERTFLAWVRTSMLS